MEYDLIEKIYNLVLNEPRILEEFNTELVRDAKSFILENATYGKFVVTVERI